MKEHFEVIFPHEGDKQLFKQAAALIGEFASQGLMLPLSEETLSIFAQQGHLVLAVDEGVVVGTAALTFQFPDGKQEFGGWAVKEEWQEHGVGLALLALLLQARYPTGNKVVAFGNQNSGPIFEKLGATKLAHNQMHDSAFEPCQKCLCKGKESLFDGQKCVDTIYDLTPIILKIASRGNR